MAVRNILRSRRIRTPILWLLALAVALLFGRAVVRGLTGARDGALVHTATRMWVAGEDPYDPDAYLPRFRAASGDTAATAGSAPVLYPPSAFLLMAPWGAMTWNVAKYVLFLTNLVAVAALILLLPRLDPRGPPLSAGLVALLVLGWSPLHTSLAMGQVSLLIGALVTAAALALARRRFGWAALGIAVAAAIKPQLGVLFLIPLLAHGGIRPFLACCGLGLALLGAGGLRLTLLGIDWPLEWTEAIGAFRVSGEGNTALGSPHRSLLVGLELVVMAVASSKAVAGLAGWAVTLAVLGGAWVRGRVAGRSGIVDPVWLTAVVCAATLLPGYHRFYDAVLLLIPAYWIALHWRDFGGPGRWLAAGGCAVFFVLPNSQAVLRALEGVLPGLLQSTVWAASLQIHQTWALAAVLVGLLILGPRARPLRRASGRWRFPVPSRDAYVFRLLPEHSRNELR
ncbi:MAG: DUF2029 domain-containing protein [Gemmatimonadota bacterium]|nr:DUF2029 domain-containing protein [Gemmatimonadota bacterium]